MLHARCMMYGASLCLMLCGELQLPGCGAAQTIDARPRQRATGLQGRRRRLSSRSACTLVRLMGAECFARARMLLIASTTVTRNAIGCACVRRYTAPRHQLPYSPSLSVLARHASCHNRTSRSSERIPLLARCMLDPTSAAAANAALLLPEDVTSAMAAQFLTARDAAALAQSCRAYRHIACRAIVALAPRRALTAYAHR